jgi:hypothetical protein
VKSATPRASAARSRRRGSLKAGLATSAAAEEAAERVIMAQTGHRPADMVRRCIREGSLFRENAGSLAGL